MLKRTSGGVESHAALIHPKSRKNVFCVAAEEEEEAAAAEEEAAAAAEEEATEEAAL
jgi:hypothetical protein